MRIPSILGLYLCRNFFLTLLATLGVIMGLIYLFDVIELLRRTSSSDEANLSTILSMALYKLPQMAQTILPFGVMIAGMACFIGMTRSRELVVMRVAGLSAWQILTPIIALSLVAGLFSVMALNPLSAWLYQRYERLVDQTILHRTADAPIQVGQAGLWLRESKGDDQIILHAGSVRQEGFNLRLREISIFVTNKNDFFLYRVEAPIGTLQDRNMTLEDARLFRAGKPTEAFERYDYSTTLTIAKIQDNFASPETVSFWELPSFINFFESAGFSANRQKLYFQSLLAQPLLLAAMVMIAAVFTLKPNLRGGGLFLRVLAGVAAGFGFYFFSQIVQAMGMNAVLPAALAAWTPALLATLAGATALFHLEDG